MSTGSRRALRLHVAVLEELGRGAFASQAIHGQDAFRDELPNAHHRWRSESNTVVLHSAPPEELARLIRECTTLGIPHALFREEDRGGEITCVIADPYHPLTARAYKGIPLAT